MVKVNKKREYENTELLVFEADNGNDNTLLACCNVLSYIDKSLDLSI